MKVEDIAYIAGFFDGDGYVGVRNSGIRGKYERIQLVIEAYNTDMAPLQFISSIFGGSVCKRSGHTSKEKPVYRWSLTGVKAAFVLFELIPHLICKKERAKLGAECVYASKGRRLEILDKMHELNKKGVDKN